MLLRIQKKGDNGDINIKNYKKPKDTHDIDKSVAEIIQNNEELENTANRIIKENSEDKNNIITMLNGVIQEGKERLEKLLNAYRTASAPISRAALAPISRAE